ncbi:hypothetical protein OR613_19320 [Klebsiella electrica]|jgi:sugar (pentulose or hexulose) kinase|uniref:Uncharacterized protein n=1 Tax=Klebsiella electrica TaxID=1259973 RepID=A0AAJ5QQK8_9ENTR|nr:hypothetical protein [Klebsiella electrica]WBW60153.1 hypothetical protein OR613_19320 [Klebsiella electrica]
MDFYPGIDIGTSRVKALLFDEHLQALRWHVPTGSYGWRRPGQA